MKTAERALADVQWRTINQPDRQDEFPIGSQVQAIKQW